MGLKAFISSLCMCKRLHKESIEGVTFSNQMEFVDGLSAANDPVFDKFTLTKEYQLIIDEFSESKCWKKYGRDVHQGLIADWLKRKCNHEGRRRLLKELINQAYKIKTSRVENPVLTIC